MYFLRGDLSIATNLSVTELLKEVSDNLEIPLLVKDESGRWEETVVYITRCFGLEFMLCSTDESPEYNYGMTIMSTSENIMYDGSEDELDASKYACMLLNRSDKLKAKPD